MNPAIENMDRAQVAMKNLNGLLNNSVKQKITAMGTDLGLGWVNDAQFSTRRALIPTDSDHGEDLLNQHLQESHAFDRVHKGHDFATVSAFQRRIDVFGGLWTGDITTDVMRRQKGETYALPHSATDRKRWFYFRGISLEGVNFNNLQALVDFLHRRGWFLRRTHKQREVVKFGHGRLVDPSFECFFGHNDVLRDNEGNVVPTGGVGAPIDLLQDYAFYEEGAHLFGLAQLYWGYDASVDLDNEELKWDSKVYEMLSRPTDDKLTSFFYPLQVTKLNSKDESKFNFLRKYCSECQPNFGTNLEFTPELVTGAYRVVQSHTANNIRLFLELLYYLSLYERFEHEARIKFALDNPGNFDSVAKSRLPAGWWFLSATIPSDNAKNIKRLFKRPANPSVPAGDSTSSTSEISRYCDALLRENENGLQMSILRLLDLPDAPVGISASLLYMRCRALYGVPFSLCRTFGKWEARNEVFVRWTHVGGAGSGDLANVQTSVPMSTLAEWAAINTCDFDNPVFTTTHNPPTFLTNKWTARAHNESPTIANVNMFSEIMAKSSLKYVPLVLRGYYLPQFTEEQITYRMYLIRHEQLTRLWRLKQMTSVHLDLPMNGEFGKLWDYARDFQQNRIEREFLMCVDITKGQLNDYLQSDEGSKCVTEYADLFATATGVGVDTDEKYAKKSRK